MNIDFSAAWVRVQTMVQGFIADIPNILLGLTTFLLLWWLTGLAQRYIAAILRRLGQSADIALVLSRLVRWLLLALSLMVSLVIVIPDLSFGSVLGVLGVGGVAVGFAFKDIFQNMLAGVLILLTRPFRIGDYIVTGSHEGYVEDIQIRATMLRTNNNRRIIIPNSEMYTSRITVNTAYPNRRASVNVSIGLQDDIDRAKSVILAAIADLPSLLKDPASKVTVRSIGDFSTNLSVQFWVEGARRASVSDIEGEALEAIKKALNKAGMDLLHPLEGLLSKLRGATEIKIEP